MFTTHAMRVHCAHIVTATLNWLSSNTRGHATAFVLAITITFGAAVQRSFADDPIVARLHVNIDRDWDEQNPGNNEPEDGETWITAYRFLQNALAKAHQLLGDPQQPPDLIVEIWVAEGTYRPDQSNTNTACGDGPLDWPNCCPPYGDCDYVASFEATLGPIVLLGGFPSNTQIYNGGDGPDESHRKPSDFPTILTADLRGDDQFTVSYDSSGNLQLNAVNYGQDNCYYVFIDKANSTIDGFTVRGAYWNALLTSGADTTVRNCMVKENRDSGVWSSDATRLEIRGSKLFHNGAVLPGGGAIKVEFADEVVIIDSFILQNVGSVGGGIYADENAAITLANVVLSDNQASWGGGAYITNGQNGPAASHRFWNVLAANNRANSSGGALFVDGLRIDFEFINCTIADNDAFNGGGIYVRTLDDLQIHNSIIWGNDATANPQLAIPGFLVETVTHSNVQGGWSGTGNSSADPLFIGTGPAPYALDTGSPCIDTGDTDLLPCDEYDMAPDFEGYEDLNCGAAFNNQKIPVDLAGRARVIEGDTAFAVDRGAYEFTPFDDCPADLSGDGNVGVPDMLLLLAAWGENPRHAADLNGDGVVGVADLLLLLAAWGECPGSGFSGGGSGESSIEGCIDDFNANQDIEALLDCISAAEGG